MTLGTIETAFKDKRVHILGVAGTLMGAFAVFLKKKGVTVTGSDQNIYPPMSDVLNKNQITVFSPFKKENIDSAKPDLVIVGNVISKNNPEMEAVTASGIPYQSLPGALETMILPHKHSIVIAGTHGKTTTSSMMSWILECIGENPSFFVGGVQQDLNESFRITDSKFMVLEGDEYDTAFFDKVPKFVHYCPKDVILTSVEYDHADIYPDIKAVIAAFESLMKLIPENGNVIVCAENETPLRISNKSNANIITYGFSLNVDSRATNIEQSSDGTKFKWHFGKDIFPVKLKVSGKHNLLNALACLTLCATRELNIDACIQAISKFNGVKRRQEVYGVASGVTLIDDFAHHPTAVRETIAAIRSKYPKSRLIACFEPRSATSRRKVFQQAYAESFDQADIIFIAKPFDQSKINSADLFSTDELLDSLKSRGKRAKIINTASNSIKDFSNELKSGDVVLVMSNGGFDGLLPKLLEFLKNK